MMDKQKIISKHTKKFTGSTITPIFNGVHYAVDKTVYATNRIYALRIRNGHKFEQTMTLDAKTGMPLEGDWPADALDRVFETKSDHEITIKHATIGDVIKRVRSAVDVAKHIYKKDPISELSTDNGVANLKVQDYGKLVTLFAFFGNTDRLVEAKRSLNPIYLLNALSVFDDAGSDVTVRLGDPLSPIILTDTKDIDILILPWRVATD